MRLHLSNLFAIHANKTSYSNLRSISRQRVLSVSIQAGFFILFFAYTYLYYDPTLTGDEIRYEMFSNNLLKGFYSPKNGINLWNGPGYPIFIAFAKLLGFKGKLSIFINPILHLGSLSILMSIVRQLSTAKHSIYVGVLFGCYLPFYMYLPQLLTETYSCFLITCIAYCIMWSSKNRSSMYLIFAGVLFGFLILTKILFWYVFIGLTFLFVVYSVFKNRINVKRYGISLLLSFIVLAPYFTYTYSITDKLFYIGNSGGQSLYWMSTPYEEEYGDWHNLSFNKHQQKKNTKTIITNHSENYSEILSLSGIERDLLFKKKAKTNILTYPLKYAKNILYNFGRLMLDIPKSSYYENGGFLIYLPNVILMMSLVVSSFYGLSNYKKIPLNIKLILLITVFYLMLTLLVSAYARMFIVVVPLILIISSYLFYVSLRRIDVVE